MANNIKMIFKNPKDQIKRIIFHGQIRFVPKIYVLTSIQESINAILTEQTVKNSNILFDVEKYMT